MSPKPKKPGSPHPLFSQKQTGYQLRIGPLNPDTLALLKAGAVVLNLVIIGLWGTMVYHALVARPLQIATVVSATIGLLSIVWYTARFLFRKRQG